MLLRGFQALAISVPAGAIFCNTLSACSGYRNLEDFASLFSNKSIYEPLGDDILFAVTPAPAIHFPQLKTRSAEFMAALLEGTLVVQEGCLRVAGNDGGSTHLVIWQTDYFLNDNEGIIEIWDRNGETVARVGEEIRMGGGEVALTDELKQQLREVLPERCAGPYWLMGELVSGE